MFDFNTMGADDFDLMKGAQFTIISCEPTVRLELVEVKKLGFAERTGGAFSVIWQGPLTPVLPQATYRLAQEQIGKQDIFLVPIAKKDESIQYEAIFT
ncbi:hypothetical protein P775_10525 [Puniceibacterium antarcticum]|uniref:DUF6916 domain-containing protein n=1 Tax=Puniceibacterium antarcticum TaxID=1206336 RepID=A0A2G8RFQ3_9RHOB|nr:hypothetical protein [Puniceibacterium antarcticum]PIL20231.1 hypothetical protein P775_10525 [Puniceibacterium antarcticum]